MRAYRKSLRPLKGQTPSTYTCVTRSHFIMKRYRNGSNVNGQSDRRVALRVSLNVGSRQFDCSPDTLRKAGYFTPYLTGLPVLKCLRRASTAAHYNPQKKLFSISVNQAACSTPQTITVGYLSTETQNCSQYYCSFYEQARHRRSNTSKYISGPCWKNASSSRFLTSKIAFEGRLQSTTYACKTASSKSKRLRAVSRQKIPVCL